jgi:hypothetical protein
MAIVQLDIASPAPFKEAVVQSLPGGSIDTSYVRVLIDETNVGSKMEVYRALQALQAYILEGKWPLSG